MITFQDIAVCYKARERYPVNAIEKIDLHIAPGEWVFLVGPSGAGKSTLLKLVYHGHGAEALHGRITVDGQDVTHLKPHEIALLRRKVGVVFQDFQLLSQKTVWENVAFALQVIGTPQSRQVRDVPRALETVGLAHKAHAYPPELSGGEQQRVAIARAIVNNPTVLLADEPTGNLDPQTAADIAEVLRRINETGTTILMATHDRHLVDEMRQRVVRVAGGRIVSDEARGVYHPEDGDLSTLPRAPIAADDEVHPLDAPHATMEFAVPGDSRDARDAQEHEEESLPSHSFDAYIPPATDHVESHTEAATELAGVEPTPMDRSYDDNPTIERPLLKADDLRPASPIAPTPIVPTGAPTPVLRTSENTPTDKASPRPDPLVPDYVTDTLENRAPLGSPDNPIVQMDRL